MKGIKSCLCALLRPSAKYTVLFLLVCGAILALAGLGVFNWSIAATSTETFCVSCHEMKGYAYEEMQSSVHTVNRSGNHASCADCHLPREFLPKMKRKIEAAREVYGWMTGLIDTPEKYEAYRTVMAERVWARMQANDSQACRNCHQNVLTILDEQNKNARADHREALKEGKTCIDCHQGVAHKLPEGWGEEEEEMDDAFM